jgi:hypothetical protein
LKQPTKLLLSLNFMPTQDIFYDLTLSPSFKNPDMSRCLKCEVLNFSSHLKAVKIPQVRRSKSTNPLNVIYTRLAAFSSMKIYAKLTRQPAATPHLGPKTDFRGVLDNKGVRRLRIFCICRIIYGGLIRQSCSGRSTGFRCY